MFMPEVRSRWHEDGYVVLPAFVPDQALAGARSALFLVFPTADEFHRDVDPQRNQRFRNEFGGIVEFPFASAELSLLAVEPALIDLAEELLGCNELRVYSIEAWAKYTGAAHFDQHHHRDYLSQTVLVPAPSAPADQVEMFLYLVDVPTDLGPPSYVPRAFTRDIGALPNWYPKESGVTDPDAPRGWVSDIGRPELYVSEVSAAGTAGTVVAYRLDTFHRGTELTQIDGARYTIHVSFRTTSADWVGRHSWPSRENSPQWAAFVVQASPRQLQLFGFPAPGHTYWTQETLAGMTRRYPGFDTEPWLI